MKKVSHSTEPNPMLRMFVEPELDFEVEGTIALSDLEDCSTTLEAQLED